ncbi:MAG: hypothetical protein Q8880_05745, partial [Bacteroidota bacterium]|nr:hypothetical protein [Bacteroidota bacterium]
MTKIYRISKVGKFKMYRINLSSLILIFIAICMFFAPNSSKGQALTADAGASYYNACNFDMNSIGGAPTASGGTAPYKYKWSPSTGLSSDTVANPIATPTISTTYTVTVTDHSGATATSQMFITVYSIIATGTGTIGCGNTLSLDVSNFDGTPSYSYNWSPATGLSSTTIPNPVAQPTVTTTYTIVTTDNNGCNATDKVIITVNPLDPVTATSVDDTICKGGSTTLDVTGQSGVSPWTYNWSPTSGLSSSTVQSPTATPTATRNYKITVTDANGCTASGNKTIVVKGANAGSDRSVCSGSSTTLNAGGGSDAISYSWSPATFLNNTTSQSVISTPTTSITYIVSVTYAGCTATSQVTILGINSVPSVTATAKKPTICNGVQDTLNASGASTYAWSNGLGSGSQKIVSPTTTITYTVTGTSTAGCTNTANAVITVNPKPSVTATVTKTAICIGASDSLIAGGASAYSWNNGLGTGTSKVVSPTITTTYTVTGTSAAGCTNTNSVTITVNSLPVVTASATKASICTG